MKKFAAISLTLALLVFSGCGISGDVASPNSSSNSNTSSSDVSSKVSSNVNSSPISEGELVQMYSNPDSFKGRTVSLTGKVFAAPEKDENGIYLQMFSDPENSGGHTIVFYPDTSFEVSDGDYLKLTGTVAGKFSGTNALGGEVTAASIMATKVEKSSYMEVVAQH